MKEIFNLFFRCADNDPTVEIYSNGESHQSRFKFQMFKWRWSGDPLFLHCEVDICNKSTEECTSRDQAVSYFFSLNVTYDECSCESMIYIFYQGCNGEGLERNRRDLEIEPTMESNMKVSNRVLTMGPLMVAVNDLLVDASSSRLADEGKLSRHFCSLSQTGWFPHEG